MDAEKKAALDAATREYAARRKEELSSLDADARAERGLGSMLSTAATDATTAEEPPEGAALSVDGAMSASEEGGDKPALKSKMVGIGALKIKTEAGEPAYFQTGGTPYTMRDLRSMGATPDVMGGTGGDRCPATAADDYPMTTADPADYGQCVSSEFYFEAGGVDGTVNCITSSRAKEARAASAFGTRRHAASGPTTNPMTAFAEWNAKTNAEAAATETTTTPAALATKSRDALTEARELPPGHEAFYIFEACGRERPCVWGSRCIARLCMRHPMADGGSGGIILKEHLTDVEREQFNKFGTLPEVRKPCLACSRLWATFDALATEAGLEEYVQPAHYHPVEKPAAYRRAACLRPRRAATKGVFLPVRKFVTDDYLPTTLDEAAYAQVVPMEPCELQRIKAAADSFAAAADVRGKEGVPRLRGYVERGSVMYFSCTRDYTPQAVSMGTEPGVSFVGALAAAVNNTTSTPAASPVSVSYHDGASCCSQGEHAGQWKHLALELCARLGIRCEVAALILGPFCDLCHAIAASLVQTRDEKPAELAELADLVRGMRCWSKMPPPEPLYRHSVYAACFLRTEVEQDIRRTVALDAVVIARRKANDRIAADQAKIKVQKPALRRLR